MSTACPKLSVSNCPLSVQYFWKDVAPLAKPVTVYPVSQSYVAASGNMTTSELTAVLGTGIGWPQLMGWQTGEDENSPVARQVISKSRAPS